MSRKSILPNLNAMVVVQCHLVKKKGGGAVSWKIWSLQIGELVTQGPLHKTMHNTKITIVPKKELKFMHCRDNKKTKLDNIYDIRVRIEKSLRQYMYVKLGDFSRECDRVQFCFLPFIFVHSFQHFMYICILVPSNRTSFMVLMPRILSLFWVY